MKRYQLLDGEIIEANNPAELVEKLNEGSMFGHKDNIKDFMKETAEACRLQTGARIRTDNYVLFVADLKAGGFLKEVN